MRFTLLFFDFVMSFVFIIRCENKFCFHTLNKPKPWLSLIGTEATFVRYSRVPCMNFEKYVPAHMIKFSVRGRSFYGQD